MREFFEALMGETGFLELRLIVTDSDDKPRQRWFKLPAKIDAAVEEAFEEDRLGTDVYFGVLPRLERLGRNEAIADTTRVLWADFDGKAYSQAKSGAFMAVAQLAPSPQILVDSGNGYHAYWLLAEEVDFEEARAVMKGIALSSGSDLKVTDKARILRVPGTRNHKTDPPNPVRLLRFDVLGRRHRFADFVDFAEVAAMEDRPKRRKSAFVHDGKWEPSGEDAPKFPDGERNSSLARLGGIMVARGVEPDDLIEALLHENEMRCDPPLPEKEVLHVARSVERYR